ncbi:hypothetical protein TcasGA2_TC014061 [Tribolium castaneum]|uniref:Uncharacterized protein n=1 Tax=Tribolium castaneum TaxID=7070 RepID=D6WJZ8_TRICA|nr:hypothetical protein TcasGA2_TC014061 [Tribolium castaneum]
MRGRDSPRTIGAVIETRFQRKEPDRVSLTPITTSTKTSSISAVFVPTRRICGTGDHRRTPFIYSREVFSVFLQQAKLCKKWEIVIKRRIMMQATVDDELRLLDVNVPGIYWCYRNIKKCTPLLGNQKPIRLARISQPMTLTETMDGR